MRGGKRVLSPAVSSFFGVTNGVLHPPQSSSTSSPTFSPRLFQFCRARAPRSEVVVWRRGRVNNCRRARREKLWVRGTLFWSQNRPWVQLLFVSEAFEMQWRQM